MDLLLNKFSKNYHYVPKQLLIILVSLSQCCLSHIIYLFIYLAGLANFTDKMSNTEKERRIQDTT